MSSTVDTGNSPFKTAKNKTGNAAGNSSFTLAATGQAEDIQPVDAPLNGDNPMNSSRPRMDNDGMLVDGPFGGKRPA